VARGDRDVVEEAKAHRRAGDGVVARRPHEAVRRLEVAVDDGLRRAKDCSGCPQSRSVGTGVRDRVGEDHDRPLLTEALDAADVLGGMDARQLFRRRVTARRRLQAVHYARRTQEVDRRRDARLMLGMREGVVAQEEVVVVERDGQGGAS
jgi:hypothetical protein